MRDLHGFVHGPLDVLGRRDVHGDLGKGDVSEIADRVAGRDHGGVRSPALVENDERVSFGGGLAETIDRLRLGRDDNDPGGPLAQGLVCSFHPASCAAYCVHVGVVRDQLECCGQGCRHPAESAGNARLGIGGDSDDGHATAFPVLRIRLDDWSASAIANRRSSTSSAGGGGVS